MPANEFGAKTAGRPALHPHAISGACWDGVRDGVRPARYLAKMPRDLHKDGVRHPQRIVMPNIAPHACNRTTAMQCGCLGHAISARHLGSKTNPAQRLGHRSISKSTRVNVKWINSDD